MIYLLTINYINKKNCTTTRLPLNNYCDWDETTQRLKKATTYCMTLDLTWTVTALTLELLYFLFNLLHSSSVAHYKMTTTTTTRVMGQIRRRFLILHDTKRLVTPDTCQYSRRRLKKKTC